MSQRRTRHRVPHAWVWGLVLLALGESKALAQALSTEQMAEFLARARVVSSRGLPKGVTRPVRLTLTDGSITHDAVFSTVDEQVPIMRFKNGRTELDFVDSYRYSIAAYRVAELLGLESMVPVTVEREYQSRKGALAWWIEAKWDEEARRKEKVEPSDAESWKQQTSRMRVFEQLVADTDRNLGNVLITGDWKLWMVDFTRAFRRSRQLAAPATLNRCDRQLLDRVRGLTRERLLQVGQPYIGGAEADALLARRDLIVARFEELVASRGAAAVLFN
jgi:hypothetical protein